MPPRGATKDPEAEVEEVEETEEKEHPGITESRWAEIKLRQSQQDFQDLLTALGDDGKGLKILPDDDENAIQAEMPVVPPTEGADEAEEK